MKKLKRNKRLMLTLLAGVLITLTAMGVGTWAWFTSSAQVDGDSTFTTATVSLTAEPGDNAGVYEFVPFDPNHPDANWRFNLPHFQRELERFAEDFLDRQSQGLPPNPYFNMSVFINRAIYENYVGRYTVRNPIDHPVSPGSIIVGEYVITNASDIPVYIRISDSTAAGSGDLAIVTLIRTDGGSLGFTVAYDGWIYIPTPILPNSGTLDLGFYAYVLGAANADANNGPLMGLDFTLAGANVEAIQATNNAVMFADGWSDFVAANPGFFVPIP